MVHNTPESTAALDPVPRAKQSAQRYLIFVAEFDEPRTMELADGARIVIGRDPAADITLTHHSVSRRHAAFTLDRGVVWVEDLDSKNGVLINGQSVQRSSVAPGDVVLLGMLAVTLHVEPFPVHEGQTPLDELAAAADHVEHGQRDPLAETRRFDENLVIAAIAQEAAAVDEGLHFRKRLQRVERRLILVALQASKWDLDAAAEQLHISREILVRKMKTFDIQKVRDSDQGGCDDF